MVGVDEDEAGQVPVQAGGGGRGDVTAQAVADEHGRPAGRGVADQVGEVGRGAVESGARAGPAHGGAAGLAGPVVDHHGVPFGEFADQPLGPFGGLRERSADHHDRGVRGRTATGRVDPAVDERGARGGGEPPLVAAAAQHGPPVPGPDERPGGQGRGQRGARGDREGVVAPLHPAVGEDAFARAGDVQHRRVQRAEAGEEAAQAHHAGVGEVEAAAAATIGLAARPRARWTAGNDDSRATTQVQTALAARGWSRTSRQARSSP